MEKMVPPEFDTMQASIWLNKRFTDNFIIIRINLAIAFSTRLESKYINSLEVS